VRRAALAALAVWLAAAAPAAGATAGESAPDASLIEAAVESYGRALDTAERDARLAEFRRAERLFARAAETAPGNAALYTNLGNAALQAEHLGTAVLAYRRALAIDPDHPRALQNLEHARSLLPEWVPKPTHHGLIDTFFAWHQTLARSDRVLAAAAAFALAALLVAGAIRFRQPTLRTAAIVPALVWLALLASLIAESSSGAADAAVVTADEVVARAADSALAPSALPAPLPGGTEVRVLETRSPWLRVRLANGRDAWVAESAVTPVSGPR
jgi:tetratricopeptide (TPR) repeat protein